MKKIPPPHKFLTYFFTFSEENRIFSIGSATNGHDKANNALRSRSDSEFFRKTLIAADFARPPKIFFPAVRQAVFRSKRSCSETTLL
ncbi:hypothetical protein [uncultured Alistipes sp.]|uniref:hypothetical protein n=1 Tax=uncultured Alistipes sp. TaxID=538949 RepID=UPI0026476509|nr:hypothetical protein [uncultured Alistipes sp.]